MMDEGTGSAVEVEAPVEVVVSTTVMLGRMVVSIWQGFLMGVAVGVAVAALHLVVNIGVGAGAEVEVFPDKNADKYSQIL